MTLDELAQFVEDARKASVPGDGSVRAEVSYSGKTKEAFISLPDEDDETRQEGVGGSAVGTSSSFPYQSFDQRTPLSSVKYTVGRLFRTMAEDHRCEANRTARPGPTRSTGATTRSPGS
ncbi:hypothetical protein ABZ825_34300 [Streptomyces tauricus]|uniref:hypothetical protein n=1 Tax=Streptomyces tauricus TaxID=68274 RepID=UPI0033D0B505